MPQTPEEYLWFAFQGAMLVIGYLIRQDTREIKDDTRENRKHTEMIDARLTKVEASCGERHKRLDYEIADMKGR